MVDSNDFRDPLEEICEEFLRSHREGQTVEVAEYAERYPELAERIREILPTLLILEELKPTGERFARAAPHWSSQPTRSVRRFGDFMIARELGRGGMGVVYSALQRSLQRRVAIKVMSAGVMTSQTQVLRFQQEARAAANLHHTNIVPVFGCGEQDGAHYYVMQYIDGRGLDSLLHDDNEPAHALRRDWARIARLAAQLASAISHAHDQGVLHRDIKPGNILLDTSDTIWITDFGLAKACWQDEITLPGDAVGTLRYMSPEQLDGATDERSDVYSLGLTLYELITWQPAYRGIDRGSLVKQITSGQPVRPRAIDPRIPVDLETIVLKAIEHDPRSRYTSAELLEQDLRRFAEGRPILARRVSAAGHLWRWAKRDRAAALLGTTSLALLLAVVVLAGLNWHQQRDFDSRAASLAVQTRQDTARGHYQQRLALEQLVQAQQAIDQLAHAITTDADDTAPAEAASMSNRQAEWLANLSVSYRDASLAYLELGEYAQAKSANEKARDLIESLELLSQPMPRMAPTLAQLSSDLTAIEARLDRPTVVADAQSK